jgi:hypothetical protein
LAIKNRNIHQSAKIGFSKVDLPKLANVKCAEEAQLADVVTALRALLATAKDKGYMIPD